MLARIFRLLKLTNDSYALAVFWLYVAMFVLAFSLIFVFPPVALLLVFVGLAGLGIAVVVGHLLRWMQRVLARSILRRGRCPQCSRGDIAASEPAPWSCPHCGAAFSASGLVHPLDLPEVA